MFESKLNKNKAGGYPSLDNNLKISQEYYNDIFVTGATYVGGTATFKNNIGATFDVTGFTTGIDVYFTGATYVGDSAVFINNVGSTFSVTASTGNGIIGFNPQITNYVLTLTDQNKIIEMSAGTIINVTVPPNDSVNYPIGVQILLVRGGVGDVSVVAGLGVTIKSANDYLSLNNQYSPATLVKVDTDRWYLFGDLKA